MKIKQFFCHLFSKKATQREIELIKGEIKTLSPRIAILEKSIEELKNTNSCKDLQLERLFMEYDAKFSKIEGGVSEKPKPKKTKSTKKTKDEQNT
ncbi:MAG: hypothetical protein ACRDD8_14795 [Bacteroidales bacterium]